MNESAVVGTVEKRTEITKHLPASRQKHEMLK